MIHKGCDRVKVKGGYLYFILQVGLGFQAKAEFG